MKTLLIAGATLALLSSVLLEAKQFNSDWNAFPSRNVKAGCITKDKIKEIVCPERIPRIKKSCRETSYTYDVKIHLPPDDGFFLLWRYNAIMLCRSKDIRPWNTAAGQIIEVFPIGKKYKMPLKYDSETGWKKIEKKIMSLCPDGHREQCQKVAGRGPAELMPGWEYSCMRTYQNYGWKKIKGASMKDPDPVVGNYLLSEECDDTKK